MDLVQIYQCLCDRTRLRILNLLASGPLCVCHFQAVLGEGQVKISKHLGYLRKRGLAESRREGNWIVYSLPAERPAELEANLRCLQDCVREHAVFRRDIERLRGRRAEFERTAPCQCSSSPCKTGSRSRR